MPDYEIVEDKLELLVGAIRSGETDQIPNLLVFRNIELEQRCQGKTPLMHAVEHLDESTVRRLLAPDVGADVNTVGKSGWTALHLAAQHGDPGIVMCLIEHDAEVNAKDLSGQTALVKAVQNSHNSIIQMLFEHNANMLTQDLLERSILHHACQPDKGRPPDVSITKLVLDIEPKLKDIVCQAGKTPLHNCSELGLFEHAKTLLEHINKLDVNAVDSISRTPMYFAATRPYTDEGERMVSLLLASGARLDKCRLPPRFEDYESLRSLVDPKCHDLRSRRGSTSTQGTSSTRGTSGSNTTIDTKLKYWLSRRNSRGK